MAIVFDDQAPFNRGRLVHAAQQHVERFSDDVFQDEFARLMRPVISRAAK